MKKKQVLEPQSAAHELTVLVLQKAANAFYRMYRAKEGEYKLAHGTFSGA
jgi:hypothetical protein